MNNNEFKLKNGKLKIMQVSDPQDLVYVRPEMVRMLNAAYDREKPDLVLFTGDNILGNHLLDARFGSRKVAHGKAATYGRMALAFSKILMPLEERKIPFAMIYGNHDDMNLVTKEEQCSIFRSYSMCLPMNDSDPSVDCDTYNIPIVNDSGETVFNIYMLDCARYEKAEDKCYEEIEKKTVEWYKRTSDSLNKVPSLMMVHIPLKEQILLTKECSASDKGAVYDRRNKKYICLDTAKASGIMGEPPCICSDEYGLFEEIKRRGDIMALVTGHDHTNCFEGSVDGVKMVQTPCASFRCYGNDMRGVRIFTLDESNPGAFETRMLTYFDLFGRGPLTMARYIWDADDKQVLKFKLLGGALLGAAAGTAAFVLKKGTKK